jgi:signal transduction histidine kinase
VHRLYSYRRLANFPVFVMVGISRDDLLARWWRDVAWNLGATAALVFAVALVALHFVRQSRLRASAEERTEEALALSGRISGVSAYLESAREEERKRIALEVHDQLGQSLTALKIEAFLLKRPGITPADATRSADEMLDMIDGTIATVRNVSNALRPVALDYGIVAALKWLTTDFTTRNRIACAFQHCGEVPLLDEMVATAIFRLAQGALTNIIRHAHARSVRVYWSNEDGTLSMSIIDDGCGFDVDASLEAQSYGLLSMRERARMCGGSLSIKSAPGFGTTVSLIIPSGAF